MQVPVKGKGLSLPESLLELNVTWSVPTHRKHGWSSHRGRGKFNLFSAFLIQVKSGIAGEEMRRASAQLCWQEHLRLCGVGDRKAKRPPEVKQPPANYWPPSNWRKQGGEGFEGILKFLLN